MSLTAQWPWSQAGQLELTLWEAHTIQEHKCELHFSLANQLVGLVGLGVEQVCAAWRPKLAARQRRGKGVQRDALRREEQAVQPGYPSPVNG